jgi:glycolate oxidase iron-sulfur subunit
MRAVAEGRLENTSEAFRTHIDRCLGCRACEQVCPAGVEYGQLLEASREELSRAQPKSDFTDRVLRFVLKHVWLSRARLRLFFGGARVFRDLGLPGLLLKTGLARLFSQRAHFALALLENSRTIFHTPGKSTSPVQTETQSPPVLLFTGCVGEGLFARVNRATERVLRANGFKVSAPEDQVCCGALHAHAGDLDGARELARKNIAAFKSAEPIVTNAGGCGAMLASYGHLLANDASIAEGAAQFSSRVRDVSQQLHTVETQAAPLTNKAPSVPETTNGRCVTYDTSCHLLYGQHAGDASQQMLSAVVGPNFVPLEGTERCCGAAGIYNMLQPEMSGRVLQEKLDHVRDTKAQILATGNPGCQMQLGAGAQLAGLKLQVCHPIELVDEAYAQAGVYEHGKRNYSDSEKLAGDNR